MRVCNLVLLRFSLRTALLLRRRAATRSNRDNSYLFHRRKTHRNPNRGSDSLDAAINTAKHASGDLSMPVAKQHLTDRLLSVFASVREGEGIGALLLATHVFLLLSTYYVLKTVRESLILTEGGAEIKAYSSAAQAMLLLVLSDRLRLVRCTATESPKRQWLSFRGKNCQLHCAYSSLPDLRLAGPGVTVGDSWPGIRNSAAVCNSFPMAALKERTRV
jgi:hypothetical protein